MSINARATAVIWVQSRREKWRYDRICAWFLERPLHCL